MAGQTERDALIAASAGGDQALRDALIVDIHAWLEHMSPLVDQIAAAGGGGTCLLAQQGATFDATADITISATPPTP